MKMYIPFIPVSLHQNKNTLIKKHINNQMYFESGRQAMMFALKAIDFSKDEHVLMPPSLCDAAIAPFNQNKININFYEIDKNMMISCKNIIKRVTPNTKAIYVIHYFGIKNNLEMLKKFCDEQDIILIEDCALLGYSHDQTIYGDISIYSLWKFHAICDGAILRLNNNIRPPKLSYNKLWNIRKVISNYKIKIKKCVMNGIIPIGILNFIRSGHEEKEIEYHDLTYEKKILICKPSLKSILKFHSENLDEIKNIRRQNFLFLTEFCKKNKIKTLFNDLGPQDIPYCFPLIVKDPYELKSSLLKAGIETEISINPPKPYNSRHINLDNLSKTCLSIPVHQNIDIKMLRYITKQLLINIHDSNKRV